MREPPKHMPVQAVNAHCVGCNQLLPA